MKKVFITATIFCSCFLFSQVKIPTNSASGIIVTSTDVKIKYKDLVLENGKITFTDLESGKKEFLYENSVKSIEENTDEPFIKENIKEIKPNLNSAENPALNYKSNPKYVAAKKLSSWGTVFLAGGGAAFLIGGLSNLSHANSTTVYDNTSERKGSSTPLIIGLGVMGAGLVMKLVAISQKRKAKEESLSNVQTKEYFLLADGNGLGLKMKF